MSEEIRLRRQWIEKLLLEQLVFNESWSSLISLGQSDWLHGYRNRVLAIQLFIEK